MCFSKLSQARLVSAPTTEVRDVQSLHLLHAELVGAEGFDCALVESCTVVFLFANQDSQEMCVSARKHSKVGEGVKVSSSIGAT
jgi:hypothetical protein